MPETVYDLTEMENKPIDNPFHFSSPHVTKHWMNNSHWIDHTDCKREEIWRDGPKLCTSVAACAARGTKCPLQEYKESAGYVSFGVKCRTCFRHTQITYSETRVTVEETFSGMTHTRWYAYEGDEQGSQASDEGTD